MCLEVRGRRAHPQARVEAAQRACAVGARHDALAANPVRVPASAVQLSMLLLHALARTPFEYLRVNS